MPSFQDSAVIFLIALLLFGPKELPKLARYIGKLMNEFRRASSEFRMQMDDEFRQIEQAEHQKKIAALEGPPLITPPPDPVLPPQSLDQPALDQPAYTEHIPEVPTMLEPEPEPAPEPIATSGDLNLMPPATGLPVARSTSLGGLFDSIPHAPEPAHDETAHG
jgi:sec-independent protein translocase protein TatB